MAARSLLLQKCVGLLLLLLPFTESNQAFNRHFGSSPHPDFPPRSDSSHHSDSSPRSRPPKRPEPPQQGICTIPATKTESYTMHTRDHTRCGRTGGPCQRTITRTAYRTVTVPKQVCCTGYTRSSEGCVAVCSPSCPNGQTCMAPNTCSRGVQLSLGGVIYPNNSEIGINMLLRTRESLKCTTHLRPCCSTSPHRYGNWFYPNGTVVPPIHPHAQFYSHRGDNGEVNLNMRIGSRDHRFHKMKFCCNIPDTHEVIQTLCATLRDREEEIPSPSTNVAIKASLPSSTLLLTEPTPSASIQSTDSMAIVTALFSVMFLIFSSILLFVVAVVVSERRRANQAHKETTDRDYESIKNFSMSDIYDDILPSPVKRDCSFDMSSCPVYERQPSETTLSLTSDEFEMTASPLYSPMDQQGGLMPQLMTGAPPELARAFQIRPSAQHE